jgi:hypothetical protein
MDCGAADAVAGAYPSSTGARERHISLRFSARPSLTT